MTTANSRLRIFLTGGSGFIGSRVARIAVELGHEVTVVTAVNNTAERARCDALTSAGIKVVIAPLEDSFALARALVNQEVVIHLAAAQHEAHAGEIHFHQVNVEGTRRLLELAARAGVKRFVHGSTIGVYGSAAAGRVLDEQSSLAPDNPYGKTKAGAEIVLRNFGGNIEWCIVRISETYGPGDMRLLKLFRGVQKGRFIILGRGRNEHQLIYVDDLARGLLAACDAPNVNGETVVLAGAKSVTTNAMVSAISAALGSTRRIFHAPMWPFVAAAYVLETTMTPLGLKPPLHRRRLDFFRKSFRFSTAKAQKLLSFRAETDFIDGARRTAEWYRANNYL
jgi:nucleoside-diphosphate-sugar epimerase